MGRDIKVFQHGSPELWVLLGPFLCNREVHKELSGPICSAPGVTWFIEVEGDGVVIGFCSLRETDSAYWFDYGYVVPGRRKKGVFARLAKAREKYIAKLPERPVKIVVPERRWKHYKSRGWSVQTQRGSWIYGVRGEAA
jgi:hypothetical protein